MPQGELLQALRILERTPSTEQLSRGMGATIRRHLPIRSWLTRSLSLRRAAVAEESLESGVDRDGRAAGR
jgi:hypothetical protein